MIGEGRGEKGQGMTGAWLGWLMLGAGGVMGGCEDAQAPTAGSGGNAALEARITPDGTDESADDEQMVQVQAAPDEQAPVEQAPVEQAIAEQPERAPLDEAATDPRVFPGVRQTRPHEPAAGSAPDTGGFKTAQARPGDASAATVDFIVKVKDPVIRANVTDIFRKDKDGAVAAFEAWSVGTPFEGFTLVGATYSGEIIIHMKPDAPDAVRERLVSISARAMADQISALENVSYCDPDYTARPG